MSGERAQVRIPARFLEAAISDRALRLALVLARLGGEVVIGRRQLAAEVRCSVRSLVRAVAELEDAGLLTVEQGQGPTGACQPNRYRLVSGPRPTRGGDRAGTGVPRKRNPAFDALAEACGMDPTQLTRSAARTVGVKLAEIREVWNGSGDLGALAEEIRSRADRYRRIHPEWPLTPGALAKWWAKLAPPPPPPPRAARPGPSGPTEPPPWVEAGVSWREWVNRP